ncbi:DUF3443 family protein [Ramlibacter sp.]|uniref:DUF3443 family protein n=1 Tax=Ramlibacter sp. TaxID=1917967 RepID=UPI002B52F41E|nr:DUF3443 family protein [Ramlibacter sp.]HWI83883.1 DUF3443 family protein [Ramlibacter sp.]
MRKLAAVLCLVGVLALPSCGGGGGGGEAPPNQPLATVSNAADTGADAAAPPSTPAAPANALPVVVDTGPALFLLTGRKVLNMLYASVTLCTTGSATACETIDHVQLDTGSTGLRILAPALSGKAALQPVVEAASGSALRQCVQYADGFTWGSVVSADVKIGGQTLASLPLNLIGDPAAGVPPPTCVSGPGKNSVSLFGANGVLGVGSFVRDCGANCAAYAIPGMYYVCPSAGAGALCRATKVAEAQQVPNPVALLPGDNNGVTIQLPPVPRSGSALAGGTVYFGVATRSNNTLPGARLLTLDGSGTLLTSYGGVQQRAIVDSGSNGYFFASDSIATCTRHQAFYCPTAGGAPTSLAQTAFIVGRNGRMEAVSFTVDNIDDLFIGQAALPGAAAPSSGLIGGAAGLFSWGLPFFFGRTVQVLFEGMTVDGVTGPAIAF